MLFPARLSQSMNVLSILCVAVEIAAKAAARRCFHLLTAFLLVVGSITASSITAPSVAPSTLGSAASVNIADTLNFTVPAGNNRLLVVTASHADNGGVALTSVTFGATTMTQAVVSGDGSAAVDSIWTLPMGSSASPTTATITVTKNAGAGTRPCAFISAQTFQGVDQTSPFQTVSAANAGKLTAADPGSTLTIASSATDLVFDIYDLFATNNTITATPGAGQTVVSNSGAYDLQATGVATYSGFGVWKTSTKAGAGATTTTSWTSVAPGGAMLSAAISLKAAPAPELVSLTAFDGTAAIGGDTGLYRFSRVGTGQALTVNFSLNGASTAASSEYTLSGNGVSFNGSTGSVTIPTGSSSVDVTLTATSNATGIAKPAKTVKLDLATGTGYAVGSPATATVTILENGFIVFNTNDNGEGSLRQAVLNANGSAGNAVITFDPSVTGVITLISGEIAVTKNLTLNGPGAGVLAISGGDLSRILSFSGVTATVSGLTLSNGTGLGAINNGFGGAILAVNGSFTVKDCVFRDNTAGGTAAGLAAGFCSVTVSRCTFTHNVCNNCSAFYLQDGTAFVSESTFDTNSGTSGDAVRVNATSGTANFTAQNSTFSGNVVSSTAFAPALTLQGANATATLTNCTITGNTNQAGGTGGIVMDPAAASASLRLNNSIVSGNLAASVASDVSGTIDPASSNNLIGVGGGATNGTNGNIVGTSDPRVAPLANNGGPTKTHLLLNDSPAINAGSSANLPVDPHIQSVTVQGTLTGSFTLTFNGQTTSSFVVNATAAAVQAALNALPTIGAGNATVTQTGNVYTVTFTGPLSDNTTLLTGTGSGGVTVSVIAAPAAFDQRGPGFARVRGTAVDIGAVEVPATPLVVSPSVTAVATSTATLGGSVANDRGSTITARGVVYAKTTDNANPQIGGANVTVVPDVTAALGNFMVGVNSLTPGTSYSFAAYATNSEGTAYTSPVSTFATQTLPNIAVEQPLGTGLISGTAHVDFATVNIGSSSAATTFTIKNTGEAPLNITSIGTSGGQATEFTTDLTGTVLSVPGGSSTTFTATFTPAASGARTTTLQIVSDDPDEGTFSIGLTGTGNAFPILTLPDSPFLVVATDASGATANFTVTANDPEDGALTPVVTPMSGTAFPLGDTTVSVSATDSNGAVATGSFVVRVLPSSNANLASLSVSGATLTPAFDPAVTSYTATVGNAVSSGTISATAAFPAATILQTPANPVKLAVGDNTLQVQVTAQDAVTVKTYTIKVTRGEPDLTKVAGVYQALLVPDGAPTLDTTGLVNVTLKPTGTFSGKAVLGGVSIPFTGVLKSDGTAQFKPTQSTSFDLLDKAHHNRQLGAFAFSVSEGDGVIGTLSTQPTGGTVLANFTGKAAPYSRTAPVPVALLNQPSGATPKKGVYTVVFPAKAQPALDPSKYPQGDGFATLTLSANGDVRLAGYLADGAKYSAAARLRSDATIPLFTQLYHKQGEMAGQLVFANESDSDVSGVNFIWLRPLQFRAAYYPVGWPSGITVDAVGTKYATPISFDFGQGAANPTTGNASLTFSDGRLPFSMKKTISIDPANGTVKLVIPPSAPSYQLTLRKSSGQFQGRFTHGDVTDTYRGILLNKGANQGGFGYFLNSIPLRYGFSSQGGGVSLEAATP
jgi:hypothetical protein